MKYKREVIGVTKRERIRNVDIKADLGIQSSLESIVERQLNWWGHL